MAKNNKAPEKEPLLIVRPAVKRWGLDYLHVTLIVLVIILIAVAFALSVFKQGVVLANCPGGTANGTCVQPIHTSQQALAAAQSVLASYAPDNSSLSLLAYYSLVNESQVTYLANRSQWLVSVPFIDPLAHNKTFLYSMILSDKNLSLIVPSLETSTPVSYAQNKAIGVGLIQLNGKVLCNTTTPIQVYQIVDPYAPGAISSLQTGINASLQYGNRINLTDKFVFTGYAISKYHGYGVNATQIVGGYLYCASQQQQHFSAFLANYSLTFDGNPTSVFDLNQIAQGSGMNMTKFNGCLTTATSALIGQAQLASYYNITTTPTYVVDCKYATIPQTLNIAINYALNQTK